MAGRKLETLKRGFSSLETKELEKTVGFKFYAADALNVAVAGTFNNWNAEGFRLKRSKDGNWTGQFKFKPGRYEYRFLVDGRWENDPTAPCVPNDFGSTNCILEVKE